jgi:glucose/arabinose dehydrogenase
LLNRPAGSIAAWLSAIVAAAVAVCGNAATGDIAGAPADVGADPQLAPPTPQLIPTLRIAPAAGWSADQTPTAAPGLQVTAFAQGLDHPRWLYVLPNGDVLVAETNAPVRPDDGRGLKGWIMRRVMKKAGAGVASADRITLLRPTADRARVAARSPFLTGLRSPFGMALIGNDFYVADTDAVIRYQYERGDLQIRGGGLKLTDLPAGPINHHWTKNLLAAADGATLYVTVGSNSNVAENGIDAETQRAAIWAVDLKTGAHRIYASGLRNPNGMAWEPERGGLWTVVNERDELGNDLPPDYLTAVADGAFYGWPYSYYGAHVDARVHPQLPGLVAQARTPDYALGAHVAALGLTYLTPGQWASFADGGMIIGEHGSWNRKPPSGYKVVLVRFQQGWPVGMPQDLLTGFVDSAGHARGRPVGVAIDEAAGLLVADDVGNTIWRVCAIRHEVLRPLSLQPAPRDAPIPLEQPVASAQGKAGASPARELRFEWDVAAPQ